MFFAPDYFDFVEPNDGCATSASDISAKTEQREAGTGGSNAAVRAYDRDNGCREGKDGTNKRSMAGWNLWRPSVHAKQRSY